MICYDVRDLLRNIVGLFGNLNAAVEDWQADSAEPSNGQLEGSSEWAGLYSRLNAICEKAAQLVREAEGNGRTIDGKREFLTAWKELRGIVCIPLDGVELAAEQVRLGQVRAPGTGPG